MSNDAQARELRRARQRAVFKTLQLLALRAFEGEIDGVLVVAHADANQIEVVTAGAYEGRDPCDIMRRDYIARAIQSGTLAARTAMDTVSSETSAK